MRAPSCAASSLPRASRMAAPAGERHHQAAHRVEPGHADPRRAVGLAVERGEAGERLQQRAVGDEPRVRSGAAHTRGGEQHEARVELAQRVVSEPEPLHHTGREVLDEDVTAGDQLAGDLQGVGVLAR